MKKIAIIGSGTWGTALSLSLLKNGHEVTLWSPFSEELEALATTHAHPHLPGALIPDCLHLTGSLSMALLDKDLVVFAVPSVFLRTTAEQAKPYIPEGQLIVDVAKGIEEDTLYTMTEILRDVLGEGMRYVALSGPTHAEEVALDLPTAIVAASKDLASAREVQETFMHATFRVYVNQDIRGVELCGALKNVVSLAAGISYGLGNGDNTTAAIITRGMAEIARLGVAMGCQTETFYGLAGIGDLVVTCYSHHSRNHTCGRLIGEGKSLADALAEVGMVVEGVNTLPAACELSHRYGVELPIIEAVSRCIKGEISPRDAVTALMCRNPKEETILK